MVTVIFRLSIFAMIATVVMVIITPVLTVNQLLYPIKIDSSFVAQQQIAFEKSRQEGVYDSTGIFIYTPAQLNLNYIDMKFTLSDSTKLSGWMVLDTLKPKSPLLLIIPDISEGAINYLPAMKQFCDRGFHVCVMNLRGQGNSEGAYYDFTALAATDVIYLVNALKKMPFIDCVAILGNRTGAAVAIKAVSDSGQFADVLILQNPPKSLSHFFDQQAISEWGTIIRLFMPALRRSYEEKTGISLKDYNYEKMVKSLFIPQMMVAANFNSKKTINETVAVYHASEFYRKRLFIDNDTYGKATGFENEKSYYDKISGFIFSSLPSDPKKTRFRKLVMK